MLLLHRARRLATTVALVATVAGLIVGCAASSATPAPAASSPASLAVSDAWVRPAAAGGESAAYLTIRNTGSGDALLSVTCTIAGSTMLHQTSTDASGMTGMAMVGRLEIPAGATIQLAPGGTHVMMSGLTESLAAGSSVELRLRFERAGEVVVAAAVRPS